MGNLVLESPGRKAVQLRVPRKRGLLARGRRTGNCCHRRISAVALAAVMLAISCRSDDSGLATPPARHSEEIDSYVTFLSRDLASPVDYVLGLFESHDMVILCERFHGVPGLFDEVFIGEYMRRKELLGDPQREDEVGDYVASFDAREPVTYENMDEIEAAIRRWLE